MRILGITAEYDPFHRGHGKHLREAAEKARPDLTCAVISGCFKQRGEPALLSPYDRAACALAAGADAVFALPAAWTVRDAEHYALGAVSLLKKIGATHLAFGAETEDLSALRAAAEMLEDPPEKLRTVLRAALAQGEGYPAALSAAIASVRPGLAGLTDAPNNTLAVCYLRAILRLGGGMEPILIPREGSYHAHGVDPEAPSASAIRGALERGDYLRAREALPEASAEIIREAFLSGRRARAERYDLMLIRRLREMTEAEYAGLPDLSEGLEYRIRSAAKRAGSLRELTDLASSRRIPRARIRRICAWAMLGMTAERLEAEPLPERAVLLGLREGAARAEGWKELVTARWTDPADLRAWGIWAQCAGLPDTLPWTEQVRHGG